MESPRRATCGRGSVIELLWASDLTCVLYAHPFSASLGFTQLPPRALALAPVLLAKRRRRVHTVAPSPPPPSLARLADSYRPRPDSMQANRTSRFDSLIRSGWQPSQDGPWRAGGWAGQHQPDPALPELFVSRLIQLGQTITGALTLSRVRWTRLCPWRQMRSPAPPPGKSAMLPWGSLSRATVRSRQSERSVLFPAPSCQYRDPPMALAHECLRNAGRWRTRPNAAVTRTSSHLTETPTLLRRARFAVVYTACAPAGAPSILALRFLLGDP